MHGLTGANANAQIRAIGELFWNMRRVEILSLSFAFSVNTTFKHLFLVSLLVNCHINVF